MIKSEQLFFNNVYYHYLKSGNGPNNIVCFHGFDQTTSIFKGLIDEFDPKQYTLYCMGLVYHESLIEENSGNQKPIDNQELIDFMLFFTKNNNIQSFSLIGFSLGARISMAIASSPSLSIKKILLLAPDGIVSNKYYQLLTTKLGNRLFLSIAKNTFYKRRAETIIKWLTYLDASKSRMSKYAFNNEFRLEKIANTWMYYSNIKIELKAFFKSAKQQNFQTTFVFGRFDKIISLKSINKLNKSAQTPINCLVFQEGHDLIKKKYFEKYKKYLE